MNTHEALTHIKGKLKDAVAQDTNELKRGLKPDDYQRACGGIQFGERTIRLVEQMMQDLAGGKGDE